MKSLLIIIISFLAGNSRLLSQTNGSFLPTDIDKENYYLFYLHGGVVTELGNNAINQSVPEWGPYEYLNILDSLQNRGFVVISEQRKKGMADSIYSNKIKAQIDSLTKKSVSEKHIVIVGASAGSNIVLHISAALKNREMNYVIMGGCWPETYKDYSYLELHGNFLSIIEDSDPHKTCAQIFDKRKTIKSFKEIKLNTGLSHGFIYKGYKEWIDPIVKWIKK